MVLAKGCELKTIGTMCSPAERSITGITLVIDAGGSLRMD